MSRGAKFRGVLCGALIGVAALCLFFSTFAAAGVALLAVLSYPPRRRRSGLTVAMLAIIAVLLIVLGVSLAVTDSGAEATPTPTAEPVATTEPTPEATATPEPTPTATPEPTTAPTPQDSIESVSAVASEPMNTYICNVSSKVFHRPNCSSVKNMADYNKQTETCYASTLIAMGYTPCSKCNPS